MPKLKLEADVIIIGAGIIGMMLARKLSQKGKQVIVCEKNSRPISEASYAGGGIISPLHPWRYSSSMLDLASWSHDRYPSLINELMRSSGIYIPLKKTGMLTPLTKENVSEKQKALDCPFLKSYIVNSEQVFDIEPGFDFVGEAIWVPDVYSVRNPDLGKALIVDIEQTNIQVFCKQGVISLMKESDQVLGVETPDFVIRASQTVIAAGAWSQQFIKKDEKKIFPVKGQMLAFDAKPGVLRRVILQGNHYLIPRHDGVILAGSTIEYSKFDKGLTQHAFKELYEFAHALLPALKHYPVRWHWSGLRPGNKRDTPYIGQVPEIKNLFVCSGHYRNGLLSAPATAELLSQIMMGQKTIFDPKLFSF